MLAISLMRMGAKKKPFYRVVVKEKRSKRDGKYLENLGTYNPMTDPAEVNLKHERIQHWISVGAQPSDTVASLIKHNPKRPKKKKRRRHRQKPIKKKPICKTVWKRRKPKLKQKAEDAKKAEEAAKAEADKMKPTQKRRLKLKLPKKLRLMKLQQIETPAEETPAEETPAEELYERTDGE